MIVLDNGDKIRGDASSASKVDYTLHGEESTTVRRQLADGQLPATIGDLYTAIASAKVTAIILVNTDTVARTVNLYLTPSGGTARRLIPKDVSLTAGYSLHFDGAKVMVMSTTGVLIESSTPTAHAASHQDGGADEISIAALSGTPAALTTHEGAADPHTGYRLETADHNHQSTGAQAGQLNHGSALTGVTSDQHHAQSHAHSAAGDGTTLTPATLNIPASATPAQTAEGQAVWDSDDDKLTIGDGASRKTMAREDLAVMDGDVAGGELAGTYPNPTVAATHSGSAHHAQDTDIVVVTFFLETPVATDDQAFHRMPFAATLLQVDYLCVGGTNWIGQVQEADANGLNPVDTQTTDTTASAGTNAQVTSFSNSGLDSGDYLKLKSTSISGTPTSLVITIQYRKA